MNRAVRLSMLTGALLATLPALAQEDLRIDQTKIHVSDPEACGLIEQKGIDAFMDLDFVSLSFPEGIQGMEFHCSFFDVKSRPDSTKLFVDAICELPGELYPDTLAITPYTETEIMVVSSFDSAMEMAGHFEPTSDVAMAGGTLYTRCDNLSEITVD